MRQIFIFPGMGKWYAAVAGGLIGLALPLLRRSLEGIELWTELLFPFFLILAVLDGIIIGFLVGWLASVMSRTFTSLAARLVTGALVGVAGVVICGLATTIWAAGPNAREMILLPLGGLMVGSLSVILETRETT